MASHSLPDIDGRNRTEDSSAILATLRYVETSAKGAPDVCHTLFTFLSGLIHQLVPGIQCSDSACLKDVYTNESFMKLLKVLNTLGQCAVADQAKIEKLKRQESKVYGLTGAVMDGGHKQMLQESSHDPADKPVEQLKKRKRLQESRQDVVDKPVELLPLEDRLQVLNVAIQTAQQQLQNLEESPLRMLLKEYAEAVKTMKSNRFAAGQDEALIHQSLVQHCEMEAHVQSLRTDIMQEVQCSSSLLLQCRDSLCDVMCKLRRMDAWIYGKIIAVSEEEIKHLLRDLEAMFQKYFDFLKSVTTLTYEVEDSTTETIRKEIHGIENQLYSIGWYVTKQPESCILNPGKPKMKLSVRLFGRQTGDIAETEVYIFSECDYENRQLLCTGKKPTELQSKGGVCVDVKDFNGGVCVEVKNLTLKNVPRQQKGSPALLCEQFYRVSFLVRSRTEDRPAVECLTTPFNIRTGSGQLWEFEGAVRWYCFTAVDLYNPPFECQPKMSKPELLTMLQAMITTVDADKKLDCDEIRAFSDMLHSLTSQDEVSLRKFVKDKMPKQGRAHKKTDKNDFSCFNWFVAALNRYIYLRENTHLRGRGVFAGYDQGLEKAGQIPLYSAWIRISRNSLDDPSGHSPQARVIVHVYTETGVESLVYKQKALEEQSLSSYLRLVKDSHGNRLVLSILPDGMLVEKLDKSPVEKAVTGNEYRTRTVRVEQILGPDFEKMSIGVYLPGEVSSSQVPAKRTKFHIHTCSTVPARQAASPSTVPDRQVVSPSTVPDKQAASSSTVPDRRAVSLSTVPDRQAASPSTASASLLSSRPGIPGPNQQGSGDQKELEASICSLLPNEEMQLYSQNLNPVPANMDDLNRLLVICQDADSTRM